jgi:hypothetical protein
MGGMTGKSSAYMYRRFPVYGRPTREGEPVLLFSGRLAPVGPAANGGDPSPDNEELLPKAQEMELLESLIVNPEDSQDFALLNVQSTGTPTLGDEPAAPAANHPLFEFMRPQDIEELERLLVLERARAQHADAGATSAAAPALPGVPVERLYLLTFTVIGKYVLGLDDDSLPLYVTVQMGLVANGQQWPVYRGLVEDKDIWPHIVYGLRTYGHGTAADTVA